jgi:hypothetical protein
MFRKALPLNFTGPALFEAASRPEGRRYESEAEGVGLIARRDVKPKWAFWNWLISMNLLKSDRISI